MPVEAMIERATNAVAAGAVASPWWLPELQQASEIAALFLPILGVAWLLLQMIAWIVRQR